MAYLKALAAREAYQQRMAGTQPEPLTALEEKQRLQRMYEEEEQRAERGEDAWQRPPDVPPRVHQEHDTSVDGAADRPHDPNRFYEDEEVQQQRQYDDFTPQSSVYLTPDTTQGKWQPRSNIGVNGNSFHNPYFESPTSSSTHLPSDGSSLSQSYRRNPAISKGKQRRQSTYLSENDNPYEDGTNALANGPPARPPKGRDLMYDKYKHFDTPVSPSAEEYERRLLWGRSQNSHHGHG